jgi:hypothetical protein
MAIKTGAMYFILFILFCWLKFPLSGSKLLAKSLGRIVNHVHNNLIVSILPKKNNPDLCSVPNRWMPKIR